ncbi:MAG: tetratricopeptide repeat protein [Gammaproteobacteria bacterium]|nr:tetratricopeptide repeat protein [Gammaproteobacteria bacterium]
MSGELLAVYREPRPKSRVLTIPVLRRVSLFLALALAISGCRPDADARNDRGVALMGRYEYAAAEEEFQAAVDAAPEWPTARINLAIATLNRQNEGDEHLALDILADVLEVDPDEPRALYTSAILHLHLGEIELAKVGFARVAELDPEDAHAAYYLGLAHLQTGDNEAATDWLVRSAELDPHLLSAYYTGSQALRRIGRGEEADRMLDTYLRLQPNPAAHLAEIAYKRMGPKAEALAASPRTAPPPVPVEGPMFGGPEVLELTVPTTTTVSAVDFDGDGVQDLVLGGSMPLATLLGRGQGIFLPTSVHPLSGTQEVAASLWADMDDDGRVDVVLCGPSGTRILLQTGDTWTPGPVLGDEPCTAGAVADADHDGDLDVFAIGPAGNELHSNNRDGSYRRLAVDQGLAGTGAGRRVLFADLDADRDLDIVVLNQRPPHDAWQNDRTWEYRPFTVLDGFLNTPLVAATVADVDADGHREIYGLDADGTLLRWHRDGSAWVKNELRRGSSGIERGELDVADFDGDGRLELLVVLPEGFSVVDPGTGARMFDQRVDGLASAIAVAEHPARGPMVVAVHRSGVSVWHAGAGRHMFAAVSPTGRTDASQMRSNASGLGTVVRARVAGRWTVLDRLDTHSGPGQSLQPLSVGLGGNGQVDFVELRWPDGVSQSELELKGSEHHTIAEVQRQLASCPVLFAWNGEAFEFVSDVLGGAALGYLDAPGRYAPPRPAEGFLLDAGALAARDGRYALKLGEPMEENVYLDSARLTVYDVPEGWEIVLDERLGVNGPGPTGRAIAFRHTWMPARATDAEGRDVTELIRRQDRRAPSPGDVDHRFIGLLSKPQVLTVEFDAALDGDGAVLVADGWIEYPYSQTVFAAWQAGLRYQPPTLEARGADGEWHAVAVEFGYPAGMPRTMALPLPQLPRGTTALRLSSNMEIYWDRLRVIREEPLDGIVKATLPPVDVRIARTGFAKRTTGPQRLPHYDYARRSTYWDAKAPAGFYTAFGDAGELVGEIDGALAVISSGEEIHLEFEAPPGPTDGHRRLFRIMFHGWAKDMDLYTLDGDTVGPLPAPDGADSRMLAKRDRLHARYNVRFREGL